MNKMTRKAQGTAALPKSDAIGFGKQLEKSSQNFIGGNVWMQKVEKGTLKINPELKDKSLPDILETAGLNFPVYKVQTYFKSPISGIEYPSEGYSVINGLNDYELGRGFAEGYQPLSYPEMLDRFFQDTTKLGGIPTRAFSFDKGAVGGIQFAFGDGVLVADRPHMTFFNLITSHDGRYGITFNEADICVVCGNTFAHVFKSAVNKFTVKHTRNMNSRIDDLRGILLVSDNEQKAYYNLLNKAATVKVDFQKKQEFMHLLFPDGKPNDNGKINQGPANQRIALSDAIDTTLNERNTGDMTIYDFFAGTTRLTSYKKQNRDDDAQLQYAMNSDTNQMAYSWMTEALK
jgi:hypothetical protein